MGIVLLHRDFSQASKYGLPAVTLVFVVHILHVSESEPELLVGPHDQQFHMQFRND